MQWLVGITDYSTSSTIKQFTTFRKFCNSKVFNSTVLTNFQYKLQSITVKRSAHVCHQSHPTIFIICKTIYLLIDFNKSNKIIAIVAILLQNTSVHLLLNEWKNLPTFQRCSIFLSVASISTIASQLFIRIHIQTKILQATIKLPSLFQFHLEMVNTFRLFSQASLRLPVHEFLGAERRLTRRGLLAVR